MLKISKNILFSTELYGETPPNPDKWWYYGLDHGQHISFYNLKTLRYIADKYGLNIYSNGKNLHLLTSKNLNNFLFKSILKFKKVGLFNLVNKFISSKTLEDWKMLKNTNAKK
jgi:hypothetical protein